MVNSRLRIVMARVNMGRAEQELKPYTVASLAREAGLNIKTVQALYGGVMPESSRVAFGTLSALCRVLDVGIGDILEFQNDE